MESEGCLRGAAVVMGACLLAVAWTVFYFAYGPSGHYGCLVSEQEQTYLQVEVGQHGEGFLDPYQSLDIYFTRAGGWFEAPTRRLVYQQVYPQHEQIPIQSVQFLPDGSEPTASIEVELHGERLFTFYPPRQFADYPASRQPTKKPARGAGFFIFRVRSYATVGRSFSPNNCLTFSTLGRATNWQ